MNLAQAIQSINDEIIDAMNGYAIHRLESVGLEDFNGIEPIDFVGEVILKVAEGTRDWAKAKCSFREFLFGCLKSDIDSFFKLKKIQRTDKIPKLQTNGTLQNLDQEEKALIDLLKIEGADALEVEVFECWMDGITKPSEIASELNKKVSDIYKSIKRLERKLPEVRNQFRKIA